MSTGRCRIPNPAPSHQKQSQRFIGLDAQEQLVGPWAAAGGIERGGRSFPEVSTPSESRFRQAFARAR